MPKYEITFRRRATTMHRAVIEAESESAARQAWIDGLDTEETECIAVADELENFELVPDGTPLVPGPIIIVLEGGFVQCVISQDKRHLGTEFCVIDYDTDGADANELKPIAQDNGSVAMAYVWHGSVSEAGIGLP